jgi:ubiquinone/menaquinone biosynthesis C-methylase UbiE
MERKKMNYIFNAIEHCNMCGAKTEGHKILGKRLNRPQGRHPENKIGIAVTVCKCTECGLIYANPQPVPVNIQDHYGTPPENYWTSDYFEIDKNYFKNEIERLNKLISIRKGMNSLDIGAGLGKQMIALSSVGFNAYGIEPSKPFYDRAISQMNIDPDRLKLAMVEEVEYPENYFDFISFGVVLEHLYDPSKAIDNALRWLKPKGIIHIEVPSSEWMINKLVNLYYRIKFSDYIGNLSPMHKPFHLYEFSLKSFELHKKNKYDIVFYEYYVCKTFLPSYVDFIIKPLMKRTNTGMQLCVWLRKD